MKQTSSIRWTTWLAVSGGVFWIAFHLYYIFSGIDYLELGAFNLLAALGVFFMALAVFSLLKSPGFVTAGKIGAGILLAGMLLVFLGVALTGLNIWGGAWLLAIGGEALTTLGLVAFSLGAMVEGPRGIWKWLPLILAPVYFVSFSTTSASFPAWAPAYTPEWLAVIYGMGWVILGFVLPSSEKALR
jgi:hypothetical protein